MSDILFIAWGVVSIAISPFLFIGLSYPLYKVHKGKLGFISYTKVWLKNK